MYFRRFAFLVLSFVYLSFQAEAQPKLSWELLSDVVFTPTYFEEEGLTYLTPEFGPGPRAFAGQEVILTGFFIPLNRKEGFYVLSKNPYASCYFCGAAGPETIVQVVFRSEPSKRYRLDELVTLRGVLRLNATDVKRCNYILEEAAPH